jgi:hypothetical protein
VREALLAVEVLGQWMLATKFVSGLYLSFCLSLIGEAPGQV